MNKNLISTKTSEKKAPSSSFVKLAMKNMVRKGNQSLFHFALTAVGFIGFILLLAFFVRPSVPH
jgi:hypothetical protein|tara:strand:- start:2826 stop:3017 length:192 start_codon:yes stop_codon:yes gene_type:complete